MQRPDPLVRPEPVTVGALALIGLGGFFLVQQVLGFRAQIFPLVIGVAFFAAYLFRPYMHQLLVPGGFFTGLGLGVLLVSTRILPGFVNGPVILASLSLGFGMIYAFGEPRHAWAKVPAIFFACISAFVFFVSGPWQPLWPLLLVMLGGWILLRPDRRGWSFER
jgi:hypothetical protein